MQRTEVICDICGARKGENNHWWAVYSANREFKVFIPESIICTPTPNIKDYCSENCASRALSEFMSKIKSDADEQRKLIMSEELERDPTLREQI